MNRLDALKKTITQDCGCVTCKTTRQLIAVMEAAKAGHWGGQWTSCPLMYCPVCDAIKELEVD